MRPLVTFPTVEIAAWLRAMRCLDLGAHPFAVELEIELRVRAIFATTPGIGLAHGEAAGAQTSVGGNQTPRRKRPVASDERDGHRDSVAADEAAL